MIKAFVKKNPNMPISEILALEDGQKIMEMARYRPK
jgi:hypothetical protein